jgi:acetyl esterase/lipase
MKIILFLCMNILLSACTYVAFRVANADVDYDAMVIERDIAYGREPLQTLDVYRPKAIAPNHKVLMFFYGGGWSDGSKKDYAFVADRFTRYGYTVIIPDYRKYPDVTFPAFVQDTAAAVAWVHQHVPSQALFVMGHSAGAYNTVMMATDARYLAAHGMSQRDITGVIGAAGPYEFTPKEKKFREVFNNMKDYTPMHVSTFVKGTEPPMLLLHGEADDTVFMMNTEQLAAHIRAKGGAVEMRTYPKIGHIKIVGALTEHWKDAAPVTQDINAFMDTHSEK